MHVCVIMHKNMFFVYGTLGGNADSDWKKCEAIAKIIAHCPRHVKLEVYYAMIGPQVSISCFKLK